MTNQTSIDVSNNQRPVGYREWSPSPDLADIIACYWHAVQTSSSPSSSISRIIPDGCTDLIVDLAQHREESDWYLHGSMTHGKVFSRDKPFTIWGIRLKPMGWLGLFPCPAREATDHRVALSNLPGNMNLAELPALNPVANCQHQIEQFEEWLRRQRQNLPAWAFGLQQFLRLAWPRASRLTVPILAAELGYSRRKLERLFAMGIGLSPHQYLTMMRIRLGLTQLETTPGIALSDLSHGLGYCDQSHFIRAFKRLVGLTPGAFSKYCQNDANVQYSSQRVS